MKRLTLSLIFIMLSATFLLDAAERNKKSYVYYGPGKGAVSVSFNALPMINFIGNMLNGTTGQVFSGFSSVNPSLYDGTMLSGKYFFTNNMSITVGAGFNCLSNSSYSYGDDHVTEQNVTMTGTNEMAIIIGANYLLHPGQRLQPVLGANLVYAYSNKNFEKMDDKEETNADFDHKSPTSTFGIIANMGVEFFLTNAVSLSAVLDLRLTRSVSRSIIDDWDEEYSEVTARKTNFSTGKMGGNLAVNFYF